MAVFMGAFPVVPGKEGEARGFPQEVLGRRDEFEATQRRHGVTKEEWSLQQTPMGSMVIVRFEAPDVEAALAGLGESNDPFDVWFKERCKEIFPPEIDVNQPLPPITQIFDSQEILVAR